MCGIKRLDGREHELLWKIYIISQNIVSLCPKLILCQEELLLDIEMVQIWVKHRNWNLMQNNSFHINLSCRLLTQNKWQVLCKLLFLERTYHCHENTSLISITLIAYTWPYSIMLHHINWVRLIMQQTSSWHCDACSLYQDVYWINTVDSRGISELWLTPYVWYLKEYKGDTIVQNLTWCLMSLGFCS